MSVLLSLAVFSALAMNLTLHFALALRGTLIREDAFPPFFQIGVLFCSVVLLWVLFCYGLNPLGLEFLEYLALFPLGVAVPAALERVFSRLSRGAFAPSRRFRIITAYDGLIPAALILTLDTASSIIDALALSLGFSLGVFLSLLLLREIHLRSALERVPPFLRGNPLSLISMGLLSLLFSSMAAVFLRLLGAL
jgi:electron transport complex protein RnfA